MKTNIDLKSAIRKWTDGRFIFRSSYYTGRGPNCGDLNSDILEQIYQGIKNEVGKEEAKNFTKFVANQEDISASAFIQALEMFWNGGCKDRKVWQNEGAGNTLTGRDEELLTEGFALIAAGLSGSLKSPEEVARISQQIKIPFLHMHAEEIGGKVMFDSLY